MTPPSPKLSVCVITYNHAPFIAQALDSVLMQEVDFDYEIIVADDASTDGTRQIIEQYASKHPSRIRALLRDVNVGGPANHFGMMAAARGQYVAQLEGDDYWTDPRKLKTQVAILDSDPGVAITFHNAREVSESGRFEPFLYCAPTQKRVSALADLIDGNFIPTCSSVYRARPGVEPPAWFVALNHATRVGDWPSHIINAQRGSIVYVNEVWGVHRHHDGAIWSSRSQRKNVETVLVVVEAMRDALAPLHRERFDAKLAQLHVELAGHCARDGETRNTFAQIRAAAQTLRSVRDPALRRVLIASLSAARQLASAKVRRLVPKLVTTQASAAP